MLRFQREWTLQWAEKYFLILANQQQSKGETAAATRAAAAAAALVHSCGGQKVQNDAQDDNAHANKTLQKHWCLLKRGITSLPAAMGVLNVVGDHVVTGMFIK